jgi:hypothetical protein
MASFRASTRAAAASRMSPFGNSQNSHCFFNAIPAHLPCREPGLGMCDSPPTASRCFGRTKSLIGYVALFTAIALARARARALACTCVTVCLSLCVANFRKTKKNRRFAFFSPSSTTLRARSVFPSCSRGATYRLLFSSSLMSLARPH